MPVTTVNGLSVNPISLTGWTNTNAGIDNGQNGDYVFYGGSNANGWDKLAIAQVVSEASSGAYATFDFSGSAGFIRGGLTQRTPDTTITNGFPPFDLILQSSFGLVRLYVNTTEITVLGASGGGKYTLIFDGASGVAVFYDNALLKTLTLAQLETYGVSLNLSSPLNVCVLGFTSNIQTTFSAGTYSSGNLKIGQGGVLDAISADSNIVLESTTGELTLKVKIPTGETASYSYEVAQLGGLPVTETVLSSTMASSGGFLSKTITNSDFVGANIQVVKVSENGIRSSPYTITTKIINHYDVQTYGVALTDGSGNPYKSIALLLGNTYISAGITHLAVIDPNLYTSSIQTAGQVSLGVDPVSILPIVDGMVKLDIGVAGTALLLPGTLDTVDTNLLNINSNFPKFAVYGGSIQTIFDIAEIASLTAPAFQAGSSVDVTVTWAGATTSTSFAIFTQAITSLFYPAGSLATITGYYTSTESLNDILQVYAPPNNTYYIYPIQTDIGASVSLLTGGLTVSLTGTLWPPGAFPRAPVVDSIDTTTTPGTAIISWTQPAGDSNYADGIRFDALIKDENGTEVSNSQNVTPPISIPLADGNYELYMTAYSAEDTSTQSSPQTFSITGGGGGGGGGGGNTGGNGHNNMAALEYNYPSYAVDVSQTQTITVLGEDSSALTVDEVITINVPLAKFKECLAYKSSWDASLTGTEAGAQPLPEVALRMAESASAVDEINTAFAGLKGSPTGTLSSRTWADDASASHDCFSKRLADGSVVFDGSVFDSQDLPKVAIRSIVEGAITAEELSTTLAEVTTAQAAHKAYLEGLFEQAVAEGRVKKDDAASAKGTGWKCPSFAAGDSLSVKVKYTFKQSRVYEVDGLDSNGNSATKALTLTIGGATFTIQTGDDGREESKVDAANERTYEIKLVATA